MATEVDTWTPSPQKEGECTNAALIHQPIGSVQSLLELPRGLLACSARSIVRAWDGLQR